MNRTVLSLLLVLLILGISSAAVYAQRGFGGRGFGRNGHGSMKGHSPGARVFVGPQFAPNGPFINNFGSRGDFNPFFGNAGKGFFPRFHRGFPIFFPNGRLHFNNVESGLGAGIPTVAIMPLPQTTLSLPGVPIFHRLHHTTRIINLPPFGSSKRGTLSDVKSFGNVKSSRATIIFLPANTFGDKQSRTINFPDKE